MKQLIRILLFIVLAGFSSFNLYAQLYPVQVVHNVVPPYSTKLNDYATSLDVKLRLRLILNDNSVNNRQVRLKLKIQGNGLNIQSTNFVVGAAPLFLNGGTQRAFTNVDLSAYFQLNNLVGINPQQYSQPLPEGSYKICWEVYDFLTNQLISNPNTGCDNVFLLLNDPPFLNLPQRGDQLTSATPFINFQWTPRHANATNVSYEFELRELWDTQIDPQAAFLSSPNYYAQTTFSTTLVYGIGLPELFPGKTYAWRVRAISSTGLSVNSVFRNDGYSEIYYFTYANACYPPTMTLAEPIDTGRVKISWQTHPDHNKYHVQYKRADVNDAVWFEVFSYNNQNQVGNLQAGVTYDFRVGGTCHALSDFNQAYSYSNINQFTMPTVDESVTYSCGIVPEIEITNTDPLPNIGVNESFTAGDFPVTVKLIEGGNGVFTGKGFIVVPYLTDTKIAVEFTGIKINSEYQLYDGIIKTTYDPTWGSVGNTGGMTNGGAGQVNVTEVEFIIEEIIINANGNILVVGAGGSPVVELPGGEDYVITDSGDPNSNPPILPQSWAVDEEGNITPLGPQAEGGSSTAENTNGVNSSGEATSITAQGVVVTFTKATGNINANVYGFDAYNANHPATKDLYKKLGTNYYMPYKGVAKGQDDYIVANVNISNDSIRLKDLIFKTKDGLALTKVDSTANSYTLRVTGIFDDADVETQAVVKQGDKYQIAGAFIQNQVALKAVDVVLVNTTIGANTQAFSDALKSIYQQAMVNLNVTVINDFTSNLNALVPGETIQSGESGFLANYTSQQQSINSALKDRGDYNSSAYYLILTDKTPSKADENGLMPLGRQFGYIYNQDVKTIAHELGHGAFQLKHPFSTHSYGWAEGATNWLLDTGNGEHLPYVHWKSMHNPDIHIGIFDGDGEGEFAGRYVITPDFRFIYINDSKTLYHNDETNLIQGTLPGFMVDPFLPTKKKYIWDFGQNKYVNEDDPNDIHTNASAPKEILPSSGKLFLLFNVQNPCGSAAYVKITYSDGAQYLDILRTNATKSEKQNALNNLISLNQSSAIPIGCIMANASNNDSDWKGVPLDCTAEDVQAVIGQRLENINRISLSTPSSEVRDILSQNYSACVFESISISKRIEILNNLLAENVDDGFWQFENDLFDSDIFYLDNLIYNTPESDRISLLKDGFMQNNHQWLKSLWNETSPAIFNNDVVLGELVTLISEISKWVGLYWSDLGVQISMDVETVEDLENFQLSQISYPRSLKPILLGINEDSFPLDNSGTITPDFETTFSAFNNISFYDNGFLGFNQNRTVMDNSSYIYPPESPPNRLSYYTYNNSFNPFEPVRILAKKDYYFLNLNTNNEVKEIIVPAILAGLYQQLILNDQTQYEVRQFGNGVAMAAAILAAPATGGTSFAAFAATTAVVGGGLAVGDMAASSYMQNIKGNPNLYNQNVEAYEAWSQFYQTYQIFEGGTGVAQLGISLSKVNYIKSWNKFSTKVKNLPDNFNNAGTQIQNALKQDWKLLKGLTTGGRYIAQSGDELLVYLDNLIEIPEGVPYTGNMYRYKPTDAPYSLTGINPYMEALENRFKIGLYTSESNTGNLIEVNAYGGTAGKTQYVISDVEIDNLLDLTDDATVRILGTSFDQMKFRHTINLVQYEFTHVVSDWAKSKGYSGIKFYGAHGTDIYENFIIFDQSTVNNAIINSSINSIPW